jgi:hypothetical protein
MWQKIISFAGTHVSTTLLRRDCRPAGDRPTHGAGAETRNVMHRIGLIVPSSNTTMETEVPALLRERERERP